MKLEKMAFDPNLEPLKTFFVSFISTSIYKMFLAIILGNSKEN